jgi:hypothetical protein
VTGVLPRERSLRYVSPARSQRDVVVAGGCEQAAALAHSQERFDLARGPGEIVGELGALGAAGVGLVIE